MLYIKKLKLKSFGGRSGLQLDTLSKGVNIVYGSNEAGKTTLLEGIRCAFFGFPDGRSKRNRYESDDGRNRHIYLELWHQGQGIWRLNRTESKRDLLLLNEKNKAVPPDKLLEALHYMERDLYEKLFAFSLAGLADLSLLDGAAIQDRLLGTVHGTGGVSPARALQRLQKQKDEFYKPLARSKSIVVETRKENEAIVSKISTLRSLPGEYDELIEELQVAGEQRQKIQNEKNRVDEKIHRLHRLLESRRPWNILRALKKERGKYPYIDRMPVDGATRLDESPGDPGKKEKRAEIRGEEARSTCQAKKLCLQEEGGSIIGVGVGMGVSIFLSLAAALWFFSSKQTSAAVLSIVAGAVVAAVLYGTWKMLREKDQEIQKRLAAQADKERLQKIQATITEKESVLEGVMGIHNKEALLSHLEQVDWPARQNELTYLKDSYQHLETELKELDNRIGAADKTRQDYEQKEELAELRQAKSSGIARMEAAFKQWMELEVASFLIAIARDRFERERQPEVLQDASKFFKILTGGAWQGIRYRPGEQSLEAVRSDGAFVPLLHLSSGTVEPLYLAMRLALISDYARSSVGAPPILMDDILVNFDDVRVANAVEAIGNLGCQVQIIVLTCHRRTMDAFRQSSVPCTIHHILQTS